MKRFDCDSTTDCVELSTCGEIALLLSRIANHNVKGWGPVNQLISQSGGVDALFVLLRLEMPPAMQRVREHAAYALAKLAEDTLIMVPQLIDDEGEVEALIACFAIDDRNLLSKERAKKEVRDAAKAKMDALAGSFVGQTIAMKLGGAIPIKMVFDGWKKVCVRPKDPKDFPWPPWPGKKYEIAKHALRVVHKVVLFPHGAYHDFIAKSSALKHIMVIGQDLELAMGATEDGAAFMVPTVHETAST